MSLIISEKPNENLVLLRLNRPDVCNALSPELREELRDAVLSLDADPQVRAIVMTGGETIFAAGADIRSLVDTGPAEMMARDDEANWAALRQCSTPIVAAVNGYALGGGCELAMHADIIVAAENASFGQPEVQLGIMPGAGGVQRLARAVGKFRAMQLLLTAERLSGREAFEAGLVSEVTAPDLTIPRAIEIAARIAAMPPRAVREIKTVLLAGLDAPLDTALLLERRAAYMLLDTEDKREAMTAFIEKRPAGPFTGN
ncbi:MAG: enoyl-CoA hydratase [Nioella sp.]|nr:enoyl-CoA hydratase [Nioella sp.]